ncbi:hypothetical protein ACIO6U_02525 [Streptomyces sp. NPDC087422]|uniref:hypothetical protein n=1 Tax=Streptomyces sp. NPDC087422 TaxID=3365786 RepID=UPI00382FDBA7
MARIPPVMPTEAPGNYNTGSLFNATTKALGDFLTNPPRYKGYATSAQALLSGTTLVPITLDTDDYDTDGGHSTTTNTSRYVCRVAGTYTITGCLGFNSSATGNRGAGITINGTSARGSITQQGGIASNSWCAIVTCDAVLAIGDYVELVGWQTSGGSLNTAVTAAFGPSLTLKWIAA